MLDVLLSSSVPRRAGRGRGFVAAALHGLVIVGAIRVTAQEPIHLPRPEVMTTVYIARAPAPVVPSEVPVSGSPVVGAPVAVLPPAPVEVPTTIPPVSIGPALDPALLRRAIASGPGGPVAGASTKHLGGFTEAEVDDPAQVVSQPPPRYPPVLQQAQIEGRVLVEFVIDTTGHLEAGSLRVLESSNRGFEAAATETVLRSLFRPARIRGQPVRQRATQAIAFRLRR